MVSMGTIAVVVVIAGDGGGRGRSGEEGERGERNDHEPKERPGETREVKNGAQRNTNVILQVLHDICCIL